MRYFDAGDRAQEAQDVCAPPDSQKVSTAWMEPWLASVGFQPNTTVNFGLLFSPVVQRRTYIPLHSRAPSFLGRLGLFTRAFTQGSAREERKQMEPDTKSYRLYGFRVLQGHSTKHATRGGETGRHARSSRLVS